MPPALPYLVGLVNAETVEVDFSRGTCPISRVRSLLTRASDTALRLTGS
jgi:hypothetical protein